MNFKNVVLVIAFGFIVSACEIDDNTVVPLILGDYQSGILVSNEGPFNNGTGTISFISGDFARVEDAIYNQVNSDDLGNVVQSIGFTEAEAYIVANVSNAITVVNRFTFEKIASITEGLNNPRYFVLANGKGYVTNWGDPNDTTDDYVAIINLTSHTVEGTIAVDFGPEELLAADNIIYVAHQGGYGQNNKLSVIDTNSEEVTTTITVGDVPNSMQTDGQGNLWVLAAGKPSFSGEETAGSLSKISLASNEVTSSLDFEIEEHPNHLKFDGTQFYYTLAGSIYSMLPSTTTLPAQSEFEGLSIYGMAIFNSYLYVTDAKDFASNGSLSIYDLNTKEEIKTLEVGLIPGGIYFNQ